MTYTQRSGFKFYFLVQQIADNERKNSFNLSSVIVESL